MKLTKTYLKATIKECIKELIKEGAFNSVIKECFAPQLSKKTKQASLTEKPRISSDDLIVADVADDKPKIKQTNDNGRVNPHLKNLVEGIASELGHDDENKANMYAQIFADTAVNTLPKMMANDTNKDGYAAFAAAGIKAQAAESINEEQLHSLSQIAGHNDISQWSKIAFANKDR